MSAVVYLYLPPPHDEGWNVPRFVTFAVLGVALLTVVTHLLSDQPRASS